MVEKDVRGIYFNENHGFDQKKAPNSNSTQLKSRLNFILILNLSIGNTVL
jgi:hypothetical protein